MQANSRRVYEIDGRRFSPLEEFYEEISRGLIPGAEWGHNLDAFNDILRGGFGTPEEGFTLRWLNHATSRRLLGHSETVRQLQMRFAQCHSESRDQIARDLAAATSGQGPTAFDWLVEIIRDHGPGGTQASDRVELVLA